MTVARVRTASSRAEPPLATGRAMNSRSTSSPIADITHRNINQRVISSGGVSAEAET